MIYDAVALQYVVYTAQSLIDYGRCHPCGDSGSARRAVSAEESQVPRGQQRAHRRALSWGGRTLSPLESRACRRRAAPCQTGRACPPAAPLSRRLRTAGAPRRSCQKGTDARQEHSF